MKKKRTKNYRTEMSFHENLVSLRICGVQRGNCRGMDVRVVFGLEYCFSVVLRLCKEKLEEK